MSGVSKAGIPQYRCTAYQKNTGPANRIFPEQNKNNKGGYLNNKKAHCFASMV